MPEKHHVTCIECGKKEKLRWSEDMEADLIRRQLCFSCNFWMEKVHKANDPRSVRVDGSHYWINSEYVPKNGFRGFGGKKFHIDFNDGKRATSTNLWHQGEIPKRFRDRLPDNAKFGQE